MKRFREGLSGIGETLTKNFRPQLHAAQEDAKRKAADLAAKEERREKIKRTAGTYDALLLSTTDTNGLTGYTVLISGEFEGKTIHERLNFPKLIIRPVHNSWETGGRKAELIIVQLTIGRVHSQLPILCIPGGILKIDGQPFKAHSEVEIGQYIGTTHEEKLEHGRYIPYFSSSDRTPTPRD